MNSNDQTKLIDRYVMEVGSHLPVKQRSDIQAEIKSMIQDMLQEKSQKTGKPVDEELAVQVLKELGKPEKVAASYLPPRYLIGPELFPIFWLVLKISLAVVVGILAVIFAVRIAVGDVTTWTAVADGFGGFLSALVATLGWVAVTFIIIERVAPTFKNPIKEKEWDPSELLKKPGSNSIPLSTPIAGIFFTLAALVIFNVFPEIVAVRYIQDNQWTTLFSLSDAFMRLMPLMNVMWVLTIAYHGITLIKRQWYPLTIWSYFLLQAFGIVVLMLLVSSPTLFDVNTTALNAINNSNVTTNTVIEAMKLAVKAGLIIGIAVCVLQCGNMLYKMYWRENN